MNVNFNTEVNLSKFNVNGVSEDKQVDQEVVSAPPNEEHVPGN